MNHDKQLEYEFWARAKIAEFGHYSPIIAWEHLGPFIEHKPIGDPSEFAFHTMFHCLKAAIEISGVTLNSDAEYYKKVTAMRTRLGLLALLPLTEIDSDALSELIKFEPTNSFEAVMLARLINDILPYGKIWLKHRPEILAALTRPQMAPTHDSNFVGTKASCKKAIKSIIETAKKDLG